MNVVRWTSSMVVGAAVVAACLTGAGEAVAAKGGAAPPAPTNPTVPAAPCGTLVVSNSGQIVHNILNMPTIKYSVTNCGTGPLAATVTFTEAPGFLSDVCPAPMPDPAPVVLPAGGKTIADGGVFRSSCGQGSVGQIIQSPNGRQGHNIALTLTDDATGAVLSTAVYSWSDPAAKGV